MDWPTIIAAFVGAVGGGYLGVRFGTAQQEESTTSTDDDSG